MERARPPCSSRLFTTMTMSQPASVHSVQYRPGFRHCRGGLLKTTSLSRLSKIPHMPCLSRPASKFPSLACWSCSSLALQASDLRSAGRFADQEDRTCDGPNPHGATVTTRQRPAPPAMFSIFVFVPASHKSTAGVTVFWDLRPYRLNAGNRHSRATRRPRGAAVSSRAGYNGRYNRVESVPGSPDARVLRPRNRSPAPAR